MRITTAISFQERRRFSGTGRRNTYRPDFARYEQLKAQWATDHHNATHEEYQTAMREIADRCKI